MNASSRPQDIVGGGGSVFDGTYTTTDAIVTKSTTNPYRREMTTIICSSSQDGTLVVYDVDKKLRAEQLVTLAVTGGTQKIHTHAHISEGMMAIFTPSVAPGTETLVVRILHGGAGLVVQ